MIFEHIPYSPEKDLLFAMDMFMTRMQPEDWVIFRDHDTSFCGNDWYLRIEAAIEDKGETGIYTGWTNRINCEWQLDKEAPDTDDFYRHWDYDFFREEKGTIDRTGEEQMFSGFLMVIQKQQWERIYSYLTKKLLGMDNEIHVACLELGLKIFQADVYLYHRYRWGYQEDKAHLK